jgi:VWFA-related protein
MSEQVCVVRISGCHPLAVSCCNLPAIVEDEHGLMRIYNRQHRSRIVRRIITAGVIILMIPWFLAGIPLRSQQQPSQPTSSQQATNQHADLTVRVKVVNVPATVRDKHGQIIRTLAKDDFILEEDGRPQEIHYFAHDTDLPLTLGLLVDTSLSQRRVLEQERHASYMFLDQMLRQPKDVAFLIHFDHEVELLQDLTSAREKLEAAFQSLQTPQLSQTSGGGSPGQGSGGGHRRGGGGSGSREGGTLLYDAVFLASDELMKKQEGRKALIVLSDGVDRGSKETLDNAIASAQRSDTVVYAILYADEEREHYGGFGGGMGGGMGRHGGGRGRYPQESRPDGKKILQRIAKETGGRFFEVSKKQPVEKIYEAIAEELRNQYSLGYTPDRADLAAGYHKILLKTKQKDLVVQARDGYYAER